MAVDVWRMDSNYSGGNIMKRIARGLSLFAALFGAMLALAGTVKEYSADMVNVRSGKIQSKNYVTPTKARFENYDSEGKLESIDIIRMDHQKMYSFHVDNNTYFEFPLKGTTIPKRDSPEWKELNKLMMGEFAPQIKEEKIGTGTVNGYKTEKFRVTAQIGSMPPDVSYQWYAKEFDIPVRTQDGDDGEEGDIEELRNVKIGAPAASLFELLPGYKQGTRQKRN
jgi:hypothetical protein